MFRMPAEWEPHEGTWLAWPHNKDHWPGNFDPIPKVYAEMIRILASSEKVFICVNDAAAEDVARSVLRKNGANSDQVIFHHIPTNSSWTRDFGPIFVRDSNGNRVITDWIFNSWGGKYPPWDLDDVVPQHVSKNLNLPVVEPGIVLEGGSIDVNGKGTLLTTEQCLLNQNRNPHLNRKQIEEYLGKYLSVTNILWLKEGIIGDDTDGHIDDIARFVDETTVVTAIDENESDDNYQILKKNFEDLKKMHDQDGRPLNVIPLPMPDPVIYEETRLPASYANFYIANSVVIVPTFRCKQDEQAMKILRELFPTREVIGIDCVDLVWGLGTFHCSTQQQPA
jgi:agmatine deiminase